MDTSKLIEALRHLAEVSTETPHSVALLTEAADWIEAHQDDDDYIPDLANAHTEAELTHSDFEKLGT